MLRNLTNVQRKSEDAFAEIDLDGRVMGNAPVKLRCKIDPNAETPTFDIDLSLEGAKLVDVNPWLRRFIKVDAAARLVLDVLGLRRRQGPLRRLRKTVPRTSEDYERERRETSGPFQKAWRALVALVVKIFENREEKQVGDSKSHRGPRPAVSPAIVNLGAKRVHRRVLPFARRLDHPESDRTPP